MADVDLAIGLGAREADVVGHVLGDAPLEQFTEPMKSATKRELGYS